jgi:hypothetical protein
MALIMGLQHCFAMVGGLITPPLVVFRFSVCSFPGCPDLENYAVSAALITSGICSVLNVTKFKIPFMDKIFGRDMYYGSGILSVMGTRYVVDSTSRDLMCRDATRNTGENHITTIRRRNVSRSSFLAVNRLSSSQFTVLRFEFVPSC